MYSIHINYIFATSWFFCLFLPTSPFKAVCENEASETVNSRIHTSKVELRQPRLGLPSVYHFYFRDKLYIYVYI